MTTPSVPKPSSVEPAYKIALAAKFIGIGSLLWIPYAGLVGLVYGLIAIIWTRHTNSPLSRRMAIQGLVMSLLSILLRFVFSAIANPYEAMRFG